MLKILTNTKIITIILIILILLNIITSIIIFADIQIIKAPKTDVEIKIIEINSDFFTLEIYMDMYNPNNFDISIEDFKILSTTKEGDIIGEFNISGGEILSNNTKNFFIIDQIQFNENSDIQILNNKITGKIGVKFLGFIKKTIPIELNVITSIDQILEDIDVPEVELDLDFDELLEDGIKFNIGVNIYNPNNISVNLNELKFDAIDNLDEKVGSFNISGGEIKPNDQSYFSTSVVLKYEVLDALELNIIFQGNVSVKIGGLNKSISLSSSMNFILPDFKDFLFDNENIRFYIPVQFRLTLRGLITKVGLKYYNPTNITLITRDISCSVSRVDGENKTQIGNSTMDSCIVNPKEEVCVYAEILTPYYIYLSSGNFRIIPDWIVITIEGDFSFAGTRQVVPLSLNAYVNLHFFKDQEFTE